MKNPINVGRWFSITVWYFGGFNLKRLQREKAFAAYSSGHSFPF